MSGNLIMKGLQISKQILKISLFLLFISNFIGCKGFSSTDTLNKIVFERQKKIAIPKSWEKEHLSFEKCEELLKTLPYCSQIVIMNEKTGEEQVILTEKGRIELKHPIWFPKGRKIIFTKFDRQNKKYSIYRIDINGTNQVKLTNEDFNALSPIISIDEKENSLFFK